MNNPHKYLTSIDAKFEGCVSFKTKDSKNHQLQPNGERGIALVLQQRVAEMHAHEKPIILSPNTF